VKGLDPTVTNMIDGKPIYLLPIEKIWQPSKYLPDSQGDEFEDDVRRLRDQAANLSLAVVAVLVGDTITEEALPSYQTWLNRITATKDETGADESGWARWSRGWTGEENRHGDVLNTYLYLSGRVDMAAVQKTVQSLIANGLDPKIGEDPYDAFVYTAFQERATRISHGNVAELAKRQGVADLAKICGAIAGDESRHERFYTDVMKHIFEIDPEGAMLAFDNMLQKQIVMPAALMTNGERMQEGQRESALFTDYSNVAQAIGVYTAHDYVDIINHLRGAWDTDHRQVSGEAAKAQDRIAGFTDTRGDIIARVMERRYRKNPKPSFSWVNDNKIDLYNPGMSLRE
jgi:acyl-[acyl-carrier-protein] desaturase